MKILVDNALSPSVAESLRRAGYAATHVRDVGIPHAPDAEILEFAATDGFVVLTADSDFAMMLAVQNRASPSLLLIDGVLANHPDEHARLVVENLPQVADALEAGAIVVFEPSRIRVRRLPVSGD